MKIRDERQMRALTGVSQGQFEIMLETFTKIYEEQQWEAYEEGIKAGTRQRKPGGGQKGALPTMADKLLFLLYYLKVYPTFDVLGTQFQMSRSKANENLHRLMPLLSQTLVNLEVMPHREFASADELRNALEGIDTILVDVTERNYRRPQDSATQGEHYSGKKTPHP